MSASYPDPRESLHTLAFHDRYAKELEQGDFQKAAWLYGATDSNGFLQGDILRSAPFSIPDAPDPIQSGVMILSRTCDLIPENDQYASLVRVFPIKAFREELLRVGVEPKKADDNIDKTRKNVYTRFFYLPSVFGEDHLADLTATNCVSTELLATWDQIPRISLSDRGYYYYLIKIAYHLLSLETEKFRTAAGY